MEDDLRCDARHCACSKGWWWKSSGKEMDRTCNARVSSSKDITPRPRPRIWGKCITCNSHPHAPCDWRSVRRASGIAQDAPRVSLRPLRKPERRPRRPHPPQHRREAAPRRKPRAGGRVRGQTRAMDREHAAGDERAALAKRLAASPRLHTSLRPHRAQRASPVPLPRPLYINSWIKWPHFASLARPPS